MNHWSRGVDARFGFALAGFALAAGLAAAGWLLQRAFAQSAVPAAPTRSDSAHSETRQPRPARVPPVAKRSAPAQPCPLADTGQQRCFGLRGDSIAFPKPGESLFGQDAQYAGPQPAFRDNADGTVTDLVTGLIWQKTPDFTKRTFEEAAEYARTLKLAGHDDWRVPNIKELFSIVDVRGNQRTLTPYINTDYFDFEYPDTSAGWRIMDAQYWSSTRYLGTTMRADRSAFGFNFADGRIKAYPVAGHHVARHYVRCVRGPGYGGNRFVDNGDGTITDQATGLMWTKADSGKAMDWPHALHYAEKLRSAGHDDWRLPNVRELQSIVDYSRAPDASAPAARGPAIDPVFETSDPEAWYWTSTTHLDNGFGYYVCFGRALSAWRYQGQKMNAHGAGAVRSDPKTGDPAHWPQGLGPQGDEIRILNFVRCVRGGRVRLQESPAPAHANRYPQKVRLASPLPDNARAGKPPDGPRQPSGRSGQPDGRRFVRRLDRDGDGKVSPREFDGPLHHFRRLDRNGDGVLDESEAPAGPPGMRN